MNRPRNIIVCSGLLTLMLLIISVACDGSFDMVIENQTSQNLTINMNGGDVGTIPAGKQITMQQPLNVNMYIIVAKNSQGENVFSRTYSRQQMQHVDGKYKVVITPQSP